MVICSFFLGYFFAVKQYNFSIVSQNEVAKYIEIQTKKDAIEFIKIDEGIHIIVNGETSTG